MVISICRNGHIYSNPGFLTVCPFIYAQKLCSYHFILYLLVISLYISLNMSQSACFPTQYWVRLSTLHMQHIVISFPTSNLCYQSGFYPCSDCIIQMQWPSLAAQLSNDHLESTPKSAGFLLVPLCENNINNWYLGQCQGQPWSYRCSGVTDTRASVAPGLIELKSWCGLLYNWYQKLYSTSMVPPFRLMRVLQSTGQCKNHSLESSTIYGTQIITRLT